jgi:hypothetical protein
MAKFPGREDLVVALEVVPPLLLVASPGTIIFFPADIYFPYASPSK